MMYIIDWITCCCYMALRKLKYSEWDAKYSAILNSSVIVGCLLIILIDAALMYVSPQLLQAIYNHGVMFYIAIMAISLGILVLRYFRICKDCLKQFDDMMSEKKKLYIWIYILSPFVILVGVIAGCIIMGEYLKTQGIMFG